MQIVRTSEELALAAAELRRDGTVAFVATMGALHAGHMKLIEEARARADRVAASIFVNPLQFGANEDLGRYPRREAEDARMLEEAGCHLLWMPSVGDIYPEAFATKIHVGGVSERWEGDARPGHFDGVATVVAKLLLSVQPDLALFGEKDFQQLAVIRVMVRDLAIPVDIVGIATVRERDGLALSSRNAYLNADDRAKAVALPKALSSARDAIKRGDPVSGALEASKQALTDAGFSKIDYLALVDGETLEPLKEPAGNMRLIVAATMGSTRLIDNVPL